MSKPFEQYFAQKQEKEKSPEEIKEEKALELIEEIKTIKEKMSKEGETIEGYERIIELAKQIEALFEEKKFFSEKAKKRLEELKKTALWDSKKKQWNWIMDEEGRLQDSSRYSFSQLLGVLAEAIVGNTEKAKKRLEELKKTALWDSKKKQWNEWMDEDGQLQNSDRDSDSQLLGVLAEAFSEKPEEFVDYLLSLNNKK